MSSPYHPVNNPDRKKTIRLLAVDALREHKMSQGYEKVFTIYYTISPVARFCNNHSDNVKWYLAQIVLPNS